MSPVPSARAPRRVTARVMTRWLLLGAVVAGIFGMHVLTAEDAGHGHGALPVSTSTAGHAGMPADTTPALSVKSTDAETVAAPSGHGTNTTVMAGCMLLLAIGAAALIAALLRSVGHADSTGFSRVTAGIAGIQRRGPPHRPRVALCVTRI